MMAPEPERGRKPERAPRWSHRPGRLLALAGPLLLLAAAGWTAYRHVRQARLDGELGAAVDAGDLAAVNRLLGLGADPDARPVARASSAWGRLVDALAGRKRAAGDCVLSAAAAGQRWAIAEALIDRGADPNVRDRDGSTPLHLAVFVEGASPVRALLEHGAAVDARDAQGETALERAAYDSSCCDAMPVLLAHGADPDAQGGQRGSCLAALAERASSSRETLAALGAALDRSRRRPRPGALYVVVRDECVEAVRLLLQHGADPNEGLRDDWPTTPLAAAAYLGNEPIVRLLLAHGADPVHRGHPTPELMQGMRLGHEVAPSVRAPLRQAEAGWRREHPDARSERRKG